MAASQIDHIFLHQEGDALVAYHAGKEITRQTRTTQERFYSELHVWVRKHQYKGPYWRVADDGNLAEDNELPQRVAAVYKDAPGSQNTSEK